MSVRVMSWVWESSKSEGIDRLVLLAIADSASDHGGDAYPSVRTLASKAKVGERTVQRAVRRLVELGELEVKANAGRNGVNVYRVVMGRHRVTPSQSHPVSKSGRRNDGVSTSARRGVTESPDPRPSDTRTVLEPSLPVHRDTARAGFDEFWSTYPRRVGKIGAEKVWRNALKRAPAEAIIAGAARYRDDPNREDEFTKHPSTWLNQGCWDDDPIPPRIGGSTRASPRPATTDARVGAALARAESYDRLEITDGSQAHAG